MLRRAFLLTTSLISIISIFFIFCTNLNNAEDPSLPGYIPTSVTFNLGTFTDNGTDTVRNDYSTDSKIALEFSSENIRRIDTIFVDINSADGNDQPIVVVLDTIATKWIDGTKYALPAFSYDKAGIYNVTITVSMKNGQDDIVSNFFVEILYNPSIAEFRFGDIVAGSIDTILNNYTTETRVNLDFIGAHVFRIDSVVVDIDINRGEDPHILIITDTIPSGWGDNIRYTLTSWKYEKAGYYKFSVTAHIQGDQSDIVKSSWLKIDGQKPMIFENPVGKELSEGDSVKLSVAATGTMPISYKWYRATLSGTTIIDLQPLSFMENTFSIGVVQPKDSGSYACIVKNEFGEDTSDAVCLNIQSLPPDSNSPDVSFAVDTGSCIEGNGGSVKVTLSKAYSAEVRVSIGTLSTTTADAVDYTIVNSTLRFGTGEIEKVFSFTTSNDSVPEQDEKIVFYINAASRAKIDTSKNKYTHTIYDDDSDRDSTWPKITFEKTSGQGLEREAGSVRLFLSNDTTYPITIRLKILSSSTISPGDFVLNKTDITFAPNEVSKLVAFDIKNDLICENDEKVILQIEIPEGQKVSYGSNSLFEYTIHDDDVSIAQFASESDGIVEKDTLVKVPVILTAKSSNQVIVQYTIVEPVTFFNASGNGIDYSVSGNNSITFAPLTDTAWIEINIKDDTVAEMDEAITMVLSSITGGSSLTAIPDTFQFKIRDNENTTIGFLESQSDVPENIGDTAIVHVWMNLTGPVQDTIKVEYTVSGGDAQGTDADYEVVGSIPQFIYIKPGDTKADIKVKIIDDKKDENIEYFDLQIATVTGGNVKISSMNIHKVRIIDDDIPYFYFDSLLITTQENVEKVTIPVRLSTVSVNEVKVKYAITGGTASGNGVDYAVSGSDTLLFKGGDTIQHIEIAIIKDLLDENDETITLSLTSIDTTAKPMTGSVALTLTIKDNTDQPAVGFNDIIQQIPEEGNEVAVPITLTGASEKLASVYFQIKGESANWNGGDATISGHTSGIGKLIFPIGSLTQNISVLPIDDLLDDDNENFTITLFNPENCLLSSDSIVTITLVDNDYKIIVQSAGNGTVMPNGDTIITRGGNLGIIAVPAANYHFANWQATAPLALSSQFDSASSITGITTNGTVTANFSMNTVTVSLVAGSNGKAYRNGVPNSDVTVPFGSILSFDSVIPSPNYHFKEWQVSDAATIVIDSAANKTKPTATFKILGNGTITPVFAVNSFTVNIRSNNALFGTTVPTGSQSIEYNGSMNLNATAATNYHLVKWTATGGLSDANILNLTSTISSISGVQDSGTVTAIFGIDSFAVSLTTPDTARGNVAFSQMRVPYNSDLSITATNKTGYHFMNWAVTSGTFNIADTKASTTKITGISDSGAISAVFAIDTFTILVKSNGFGTVSPTVAQKVVYKGSLADVRVVDSTEGYRFKDWTLANTAKATISPDNLQKTITINNVTGNDTVIANFERKQYSLTVNVNDNDGIVNSITQVPVPEITGKYSHGTVVSLSVALQPGWKIDGWTNTTGTGTSAAVTMVRDSTITVKVSPITPVPANIICVKYDALQNGGGAIGSSWVDAYTDLNAALAVSEGKTVWVAKGTYTTTDINTPFTLLANSSVIGGFTGTESTAASRDSIHNMTILSGKVSSSDNARAVINVPSGADNIYFSTFTIDGAVGNSTAPYGGVYALNSKNLVISRCILSNNSPCAVEAGNKSKILQCVLTGNSGANGSAVSIKSDSVFVINSVISHNTTAASGAITVYSNMHAILVNNTIINNTANSTAGIYCASSGRTFISNCIVWGNKVSTGTGTQINLTDTVYYTNVQDSANSKGVGFKRNGWSLTGNLDTDPLFNSMDNLAGADGYIFTDDDGLILSSGSQCVNTGGDVINHNEWKPNVDIRGRSRLNNRIDMGAYER